MLPTTLTGKVVVALEGGYNLRSISRAAAACLATLLGEPVPDIKRGAAKLGALQDIETAVSELAPYWKCLQPPRPSVLPSEAPVDKAMRRKKQRAMRRARGPWWFKFI